MKLGQWLSRRSPGYIARRGANLIQRYGLTPTTAQVRVEDCVATLADLGCAPTFPTPGRVVQRYPGFLRQIQAAGAEIAVHSYDHIDLAAYPLNQAQDQLLRAARVFLDHGLEVSGFRCPYLSCTDALLDALPAETFAYSSNRAVSWDVTPKTAAAADPATFEVLHGFYAPLAATETVCVPWSRGNLVEIPVCLPDDLQLSDGLQLDSEGIASAWSQILFRTHQRGELFALLFHPELAWRCLQGFITVLENASQMQPGVWVARLQDISQWWQEKTGFAITTHASPEGLRIDFTCSQRATILLKGLNDSRRHRPWFGSYHLVEDRTLELPSEARPFVGLSDDVPEHTVRFLREQGYLVEMGRQACRCAVYLDADTLSSLPGQLALVEHIEKSSGPLVRFWRWPNGFRSALCVSGDLDALSLLDYASRVWIR